MITAKPDKLSTDIKTAFDALGLILVFVTVLFGLRYGPLARDLDTTTPPREVEHQRMRYRRMLWRSLSTNCLPLVVVNSAAVLILLPVLVEIVHHGDWSLSIDALAQNTFLFIFGMISVFFGWSLYLTYRLLKKIYVTR